MMVQDNTVPGQGARATHTAWPKTAFLNRAQPEAGWAKRHLSARQAGTVTSVPSRDTHI